jgi:hypothetical protein
LKTDGSMRRTASDLATLPPWISCTGVDSQGKKSFLSLVSAVHFTPYIWARSMVLRVHFGAAIFGSFVLCFFPSIHSWILDPVRRYLGFCHCFIRRLQTSFFCFPPEVLRVHEQRTVVRSPAGCFPIRASGMARYSVA